MKAKLLNKGRWADHVSTILVSGSLWGFTEVVLGGAMAAAGLPYRSGVLTGLGMGIMAVAIGAFAKPAMLAGIALVAVLCKQLVVPILHVSIMCKANSCLAVLLDGFALLGAVSVFSRRLDSSYLIRTAVGALAALSAAVAFFFVGMHLAPCKYLLSFNHPGGLISFLTVEGLPWMLSSALLFPAGYWIGGRLGEVAHAWRSDRPLLYYTIATATVICCWGASAAAIAAGL